MIMKKMKKFTTLLALLLFFAATPALQAQTGFDDDVDDEEPQAPIDNLLYVGMLAGTILAYKFLSNKENSYQ